MMKKLSAPADAHLKSLLQARRALLQIMQMMEAKGLLNSAAVSQLMTLVENRNQVIFAAFEAFEADEVQIVVCTFVLCVMILCCNTCSGFRRTRGHSAIGSKLLQRTAPFCDCG
jgi:hypothetical protein